MPWEEQGIPLEKPAINITTNATLLNKEIIEFCVLHKIYLSVSFDGPPAENDKYSDTISLEELTGVINHDPLLKTWLKFVYAILAKAYDTPKINENFFNSCFVGKAGLFVDTKGKYHLCERSDFSMPIGDVHSGKDEEAITHIYTGYFKVMDSKECRNCWAAHFCTLCIAALVKEGKIVPAHRFQCEDIRSSMEAQIKDLLYIKKFYPKILLCMDNMYAQANDTIIDDFLSYINEN